MMPKRKRSHVETRSLRWAAICFGLLAGGESWLSGQDAGDALIRGAEIWEQQCATCHGITGGGVQGKYEHRLSGPGSLEELASLIEQTMPEEDPEKCVGEDARSVARYLLDGILAESSSSRTPRRELQHLTGNQYLVALAALGETFLGRPEPAGESGLKARYFDGREFKQEKRVAERFDSTVNFDWQASGPLGEQTSSEEFCIEWSGAVFIAETGEYEWLIRSPNGYRLYLNRQDEPLLDSWVATRDEPEKSARVKMVGGRWYPVRLQALKVKDPSFSIQWLWRRPRRLAEVVPVHSLRAEMVDPTLLVQTPFPADDHSLGFERGALFTPEWEEATTQAALEVGERILPRLPALVGAKKDSAEFSEKCREFCERFAVAAFRRPLDSTERELYVDTMFVGRTPEDAVQVSLLAILKSPWFLYLGLERDISRERHVAEAITRVVTDSWATDSVRDDLPDSELADLNQQTILAEKLLESPAGQAKWRRFFADWLGLEEAAEVSKDKEAFVEFDAALLDDLQESVLRFVDDVWQSPSADFRELLLANELWMNSRMRRVYGPQQPPVDASGEPDPVGLAEFEKVELKPEERAGLLTHPLLLSQLAYFRSTSPIHRGVFVTRNILGLALKPPPVAVEPMAEESAAGLTTRQRVELQTRPDNCMGCHQVINPFGFALERYDAIGRIREQENGRALDTLVSLSLPGKAEVKLNGARELAEYLANQRETHRHFVRAVFQHAVQQQPEGYSPDLLDELTDEFVAGQFNMRKLVVAIALRTANYPAEQEPGDVGGGQ